MSITYTAEYYQALEAKLAHHPHRCRVCKIADGAKRINRYGDHMKQSVTVSLALVDPSKPANDPSNVDLYCTKCRKPLAEWRAPSKTKPSKLPQLF